MSASKILFITQEFTPYVLDSVLTPLGRQLPLGALEKGHEVRAFMPKWGDINERRNQLHEVIRLSGMNLIMSDNDHPLIIKVASVTGTRMQVYFIDNEELFGKRLHECDEKGVEYTDNAQRAIFYARGVLETVKKLRWVPDVIHCQGWVAGMAPLYLKTAFAEEPSFRNCRVVYTLCDNPRTLTSGDDLGDQLTYRNAGPDCLEGLGNDLTPKQMEMLAIKYADGVTFANKEADAELVEYAKTLGKPTLVAPETAVEEYLQFFDQVEGNAPAKE